MAEPVRFQHYEVLRRDDGSLFELGRGAMGITYKAFDTNLRTNVALKVINATYLNSEVARQRFLREARAAAAIRHPNVATVFHLGNEDDAYFYAMEFIDGETVEAFMQREGAVPTLMALEIAAQVARALGAAEKQGLVHRDIKPSNLMLVREPGEDEFIVKVIDFGLAKAAEKDGADVATLTQGGFLGTPHFASPEQLEERELDSRSDIYSLGVTLYYMLAGRTPFSGSLAQVMSQHLHREPPLELLSAQPRQVIALLERMMAKDPGARPQLPSDLRREIDACVTAVSTAHTGTVGGAPAELADADTITDAPREPGVPEPAPGVKLAGRLELIEEYQPGEYGKTFRARDEESGKIVAVLILDPNLLPTSDAYTRLENEVIAVQAVKHPAIIRVFSLERVQHLSFITREWVEGMSLLDAMRRRGTMPVSETIEILTSLAGGLEAVQKTGVPCPALSAPWITLVKEGGATLPKFNALNFDAVAPASPDATLVSVPDARSVRSEAEYVFSLAVLAYRMLGGMAASENLSETFIPIPGISEDANLVLRHALKPRVSYASPVAFVAALEDAIGDVTAPALAPRLPPLPTVIAPPRHRSSPWTMVITALLVLLLAVLGLALFLEKPWAKKPLEPAPVPSPTPESVPTPTPTPVPTPPPTPDPLTEAIKRASDLAVDNQYVVALSLLEELTRTHPEAAGRLAEEIEKIVAKLRASAPNDILPPDQLGPLSDALEGAAQQGSKSAAMLLARSTLASDPDTAFKNFVRAAEQGDSEAMYQLGDMFATGRGTEQDDAKAVEWYRKSATLLEPQAMFALGQAYFFGKGGLPKDYALAFQMLKPAADTYDNRLAQNLLGDIYRKGLVGKPNYGEAFRLWTRAAAQGWLDSQAKLGVMYFMGEVVDGKPAVGNPDPTRADVEKGFELFKSGAEAGNPSSMFYYASCLRDGVPGVVKADAKAGREWMINAARRKDPQALDWCQQNRVKINPPRE